jgi:hypothetical protein
MFASEMKIESTVNLLLKKDRDRREKMEFTYTVAKTRRYAENLWQKHRDKQRTFGINMEIN